MSQELLYTSAPQGLKPGSRGFCTVASTAGMAKNLADRLESLSAYRHVFPPNDPNTGLNPIVYSHLRIVVGGRPYHVLSRICAAGLDYTQRSNKLAHHVALDVQELVAAGPAALLASADFMESTWNGAPRVLSIGRRPPQVSTVQGICHTWQRLTGDSGWGGRLAETAISNPRRRVAVIFQPGIETLPLVAEALALLPPPIRWQVTFSTYYTKLPPGIDCMWRFVLAGSPEAKAAERSPQFEVIDLCKKLGHAPNSALVEAARTGVVPPALENDCHQPEIAVAAQAALGVPLNSDCAGAGFDLSKLDPIPLDTGIPLEMPTIPQNARRFRRVAPRKRVWPIIVGGSSFVLILIVTVAYSTLSFFPHFFTLPKRDPELSNLRNDSSKPAPPENEIVIAKGSPSGPEPPIPLRDDTTALANGEKSEVSQSNDPIDRETTASLSAHGRAEGKESLPSSDIELAPQTQVGDANLALDAPESVNLQDFPKTQLAQLEMPPILIGELHSSDFEVQLVGGDKVLESDGQRFEEKRTGSSTELWLSPARSGSVLSGKVKIATLHVSDGQLWFRWDKALANLGVNAKPRIWAESLRNCILRVRTRDGRAHHDVALRKPIHLKKLEVRLGADSSVALPIDPWPPWPIRLEVADPPAQSGYQKVLASDGVRLTHNSNKMMPVFRLVVDAMQHRVVLSYDSELPEVKEKNAVSLKGVLAQIPMEQNLLQARIDDTRKKAQSEKDNDERKKIEFEIDQLNARVDALQEKATVLEHVLKLENQVLPFSVVTYVDGTRIVLALSSTPTNTN